MATGVNWYWVTQIGVGVLLALLAHDALRHAGSWGLTKWRQWRRKGAMPRRTVGRLVVRP